jgi:hypothetical protein
MAARSAINDLAHQGAAAPSIVAAAQREKVELLRTNLHSAAEAIHEAELALVDRDAPRFSAAMQRFHKAYAAVPQPATAPTTRP